MKNLEKACYMVSILRRKLLKDLASRKDRGEMLIKASSGVGPFKCEIIQGVGRADGITKQDGWTFMSRINEKKSQDTQKATPSKESNTCCKSIKALDNSTENGAYWLHTGNRTFQVYCDMKNGGYTLIARFSNADAGNWMQASGEFWYTTEEYGQTNSTIVNSDMLSLAFSMVNGSDIKVSRSDDIEHTALLNAPGCLLGTTMRARMTSYGDFRNGKVWTSSDRCLGNCSAVFSGQYATTVGFKYATSTCTASNDILNGNNIGFWCRYSTGDGSVIMIGGGGASCARADHGIGVTEEDNARLGGSLPSKDFGDDGASGATTYSLNLWIK
eukprot:gene11625-21867_t